MPQNTLDPDGATPSSAGLSTDAAARIARRVLRQWPLILVCTIVAAVVAYGVSSSRAKQYEATSVIQVGSVDLVAVFLSSDIQIQDSDPARQTKASTEIFNLANVRKRAVEELGPTFTSAQIEAAIKVVSSPDSSVIRVVARDTVPDRAQKISAAMVRAFITQRIQTAKRSLTTAKKQVRRQYDNLSKTDQDSPTGQALQERLRQVGVLGAIADGNVDVIQIATVPTGAVSPRPKRDGILGLLAGAILGLGFAVLRARFDDRIRDTDELTEVWDLPVVGLVPQTSGLRKVGRELPDGPALEALSLARTNLRYLHVGGRVKTVLVTSALVGEGKSTIALNLAMAAALAKSRVLVIEGDLRRPTISKRLDLTVSGNGLSEVLAGITTVDNAITTVKLEGGDGRQQTSIDLLPAGLVPPSPVALLEGDATRALLTELRTRYDIILIDTPPAIVVADALAIIDEVDGVVVVSRLGTVSRSALRRLRDTLTAVDAPVLGLLVNSGAEEKSYSYYTDPSGAKAGRRAKKATAPEPS